MDPEVLAIPLTLLGLFILSLILERLMRGRHFTPAYVPYSPFTDAPYPGGHILPAFDISQLVVGQEVSLLSGYYFGTPGKVVKVTQEEVIVQFLKFEGPITDEGPELVRFDKNGKACDSRDIYKGNFAWAGIPGTFEGGPWELQLSEVGDAASFLKAQKPRSTDEQRCSS